MKKYWIKEKIGTEYSSFEAWKFAVPGRPLRIVYHITDYNELTYSFGVEFKGGNDSIYFAYQKGLLTIWEVAHLELIRQLTWSVNSNIQINYHNLNIPQTYFSKKDPHDEVVVSSPPIEALVIIAGFVGVMPTKRQMQRIIRNTHIIPIETIERMRTEFNNDNTICATRFHLYRPTRRNKDVEIYYYEFPHLGRILIEAPNVFDRPTYDILAVNVHQLPKRFEWELNELERHIKSFYENQ